jgi:hypothetical protein
MPALLADVIVQTLTDTPGIGRIELLSPSEDAAAAVPGDATVIILTASQARHTLPALLAQRPRAAVLVLGDDGDTGSVVELWPRRRQLGELSPEQLRRAVGGSTTWSERFAHGVLAIGGGG